MAFDLRGPFEFLSRWLENRGERKDAATLRDMLKDFPKSKRKFSTLKRRLRGIPDDDLRRILRSIDAVSFTSSEGEELWGLTSRNPGATSVDGP